MNWLALIFVQILVCAPGAWGEELLDNTEEIVRKLEADLCAPKIEPTEGGFCADCAPAAVSLTPKLDAELADDDKMELHFLEAFRSRSLAAADNLNEQIKFMVESIAEAKENVSALRNVLAPLDALNEGLIAAKPIDGKDLVAARKFLSERMNKKDSAIAIQESTIKVAEEMNKPEGEKDKLEEKTLYLYPTTDLATLKGDLETLTQERARIKSLLGHLERAEKQKAILNPEDSKTLSEILSKEKEQVVKELDFAELLLVDQEKMLQVHKNKLEAVAGLFGAPAKGDARAMLKHYRQALRPLKEVLRERKGYSDCGLTPGEEAALWEYTGHFYGEINRAMRAGGPAAERHKGQIHLLKRALKKIKPFSGPVRRGADLPPEVLAQHQPGQVVNYSAFTSTSVGTGFLSPHRLVIHSKTGRFIAPYSEAYSEYEVLFAPTKFKVVSRKDLAGGKVEIVLQEED